MKMRPDAASTMRFSWLHALASVADSAVCHWPLLAALAVFPGREHMPRSLGSVLGATVARFLPHGPRGALQHLFDVRGQEPSRCCAALSPDKRRVYVGDEHGIQAFDMHSTSAAPVHAVTDREIPLQGGIVDLAVADDGSVYVGEALPHRVFTLTPSLAMGRLLCGATTTLKGIAVHADTLFVLQRSFELDVDQVHVYDRSDGEPLTQYRRVLNLRKCSTVQRRGFGASRFGNLSFSPK
jgi:hypothetical protein